MVEGLEIDESTIPSHSCEPCIQSKLAHRPFPQEASNRSQKPGERVIGDVWGPARTKSIGNCSYYISFTDDGSRLVGVLFLKEKGGASEAIKSYVRKLKKKYGKGPTYMRFDNGKELVNAEIKNFCAEEGITLETTAPYSPSQNGVAERLNRTLIELANAMLISKGLPKRLWAEAVSHAAYIRNRCPTKALEGKTPLEAWSGRKPDVSHLREFGSDVYILTEGNRDKIGPKAVKMTFVGFEEGSKAIRYYDKAKGNVKISRNFAFSKNDTPGELEVKTTVPGSKIEGEKGKIIDYDPDNIISAESPLTDLDPPSETEQETEKQSDQSTSRTLRPRGPQVNYKDLGSRGHTGKPLDVARPTLSSAAKQKGRDDVISNISYAFMAGSEPLNDEMPKSIAEAKSSPEWPQWKEAIDAELAQLDRMGTWELAELPKDRKAIGNRWVFDKKRNKKGEVIRFKARLVAQGFSQRPGLDYGQTFAPVVRLDSLRILLALAAKKDWETRQMDVIGAYLWSETKEEVYMVQPCGFDDGTGRVCRIRKSLYGMKQAGRNWNQKFHHKMTKLGFNRLKTDYSAYIRWAGDAFVIIIAWVDDLVSISNSVAEADRADKDLAAEFDIKFLGEPSVLLGIQVTRDRDERKLSLCQSNYIQTMLKRFGMENANPVATPLDPNVQLFTEDDVEGSDDRIQDGFAQITGSLLYAAQCTRPDISYAVQTVSQFTQNPKAKHWTAIKRILRYLKGTINHSLVYQDDPEDGKNQETLQTFTDSDWASNAHRKSISGYVVMLSGGAVAWSSKKQTTVALSTAEAEYIAATHAAKQILWQTQFLQELGIEQPVTAKMFSDNQATISISKNPEFHARTKHIDINLHFLRDLVEEERVALEHVASEANLADIFTKTLPRQPHERIRELVGVISDQGGVLESG
jgi:hypothetical protein